MDNVNFIIRMIMVLALVLNVYGFYGGNAFAAKTPNYYGPEPNWAWSPQPTVDSVTKQVVPGTGIRKFVDGLPRLGSAGMNNLGQYLPVAVADKTTYNGSDYYEIALVEYKEQMHSDLPPTLMRGYVQIETLVNAASSLHYPLTYTDGTPILDAQGQQVYGVDKPHYMGPIIISQRNTPTRIKFTNYLPTGAGATCLFL